MQTQRTPARRTAPQKRRGGAGGQATLAFVALGVLVALVLAYLFQYKWFPDGLIPVSGTTNAVSEINAATSVRINEVMSSNGSAWSDEKGRFGDWIEIVNASSTESADISGWKLTDAANSLTMFTFPRQTLAPGEFVIVFCDGTLQNAPGYAYHAPFKLSSDGDGVMLFNAAGTAVQSLNVPSLNRNQSYAYTGSGWETTLAYTPGMPNEQSYHDLMRQALSSGATSDIVITEIMADNATYIPDEDGEYCDWIEIGNTGSTAVSLNGWCLSDDPSNPTKWRFPDITLGAGEYVVVYASGKDRSVAGSNLHAGFKLNAEGESAVLSNPSGMAQSAVSFSLLKADRSLSLYGGEYTTNLAPTPGAANTAASASAQAKSFDAANISGVYINEVYAGESRTTDTSGLTKGWLEIRNTNGSAVDLSGWGLSDEPDKPRKWQFENGTTIAAGDYMLVYLTGADLQKSSSGAFEANFAVSLAQDACETLTLCAPDGRVLDRMPLIRQYASISYGRIPGQDGFFYLGRSTQGAANADTGYPLRVNEVEYSVSGGLYDGPVTVELSADEGCVIRYTADGSEPSQDSQIYSGPLLVTQTTVLRARAWREGDMRSAVSTQTYFIGLSHTVNVISLVTDPENLWSDDKGIYVMGPNALAAYPYGSINRGANFWMTWERSANVEYYAQNGGTILSQGCGLTLHGQYSRAEDQKALRLIARYEYDEDNRFHASLFSKRDYTEYKSFLLRSSSNDGNDTRMCDSILTSLAENTSVMYQETEVVVVYLNGEYWGQYNLRERINKHSIAQWEGWQNLDDIDIVKANTNVLQGSDETYATMLAWVKKNGVKNDKALQYVESVIDVDNYIEYIALEMFVSNPDTLNVKRYRSSSEGDGRWKWIYFDLDWAFYHDSNSITRWTKAGGMGTDLRTDNALFVALMRNSTFRDRFFTRLGELMATDLTTRNIVDKVNERIAILMPEIEMQAARWDYVRDPEKDEPFTVSVWKRSLEKFISYAESRPKKLLGYIQNEYLKCSDEQMDVWFKDAKAAIAAYDSGL